MSKPSPKRPPNPTLRWALMLAGVIVVFGGVFAIKAFFAKRTASASAVASLSVACSRSSAKPAAGNR